MLKETSLVLAGTALGMPLGYSDARLGLKVAISEAGKVNWL
ncbi:MAG TPA: hypothetical protein VNJ52_02275 [Patescibacteria group bacterium]|nr:hypothetical protein [Patescibacteria group bacterium]